MAYFIRRKIPYILGMGFLQYKDPEKEILQNETGRDRLYKMFAVDKYGNQSAELYSALQITTVSLFVGSLYGGIRKVQEVTKEFIDTNQATKFMSEFDAKRSYQHVRAIAFLKGAYQIGWRMTIFTASFVFITTMISVYRNKNTPWEYSIAGFITGGIYKTSLGPMAMLVGAIAGGVLGTLAGFCTVLILKLSGMTMQDLHYHQYAWKEHAIKIKKKAETNEKSQNEHEMKEIFMLHDELIKEMNEQQQETKENDKLP